MIGTSYQGRFQVIGTLTRPETKVSRSRPSCCLLFNFQLKYPCFPNESSKNIRLCKQFSFVFHALASRLSALVITLHFSASVFFNFSITFLDTGAGNGSYPMTMSEYFCTLLTHNLVFVATFRRLVMLSHEARFFRWSWILFRNLSQTMYVAVLVSECVCASFFTGSERIGIAGMSLATRVPQLRHEKYDSSKSLNFP